jgi:hypothetical protein
MPPPAGDEEQDLDANLFKRRRVREEGVGGREREVKIICQRRVGENHPPARCEKDGRHNPEVKGL